MIGEVAFVNCTKLEHVELSEGLEDIGTDAFLDCKLLNRINVPSTVKVIRERTFRGCVELVHVELEDGLEQIMDCAFECCMSLEVVKVPKSVTHINPQAFQHCQSLIEVKFYEEVEVLVREASIQNWWKHGVSELSLITYSLLAEHRIPELLGMLKVLKWHLEIHTMLKRIPAIESHSLNQYLHSIHLKVSAYEGVKDVATVLELAIWKSKMIEQYGQTIGGHSCSATKMGCRIKCGATVIIPNVLSFL